MKIERRKLDFSAEALAVMGMITSDSLLREMALVYDPDLFEHPSARIVSKWCIRYFEKYDKAPGKLIEDIFRSNKRRKTISEEEAEWIQKMLARLSDQYESNAQTFNVDYVMDQAVKHFNVVRMRNMAQDVISLCEEGKEEEAGEMVGTFRHVERPSTTGFNPLTSIDVIRKAFQSREAPLFTMPGAFGELINEELLRENLIGIMAKEKAGKTYLLMELGFRAVMARCNVAFFEIGDMSEGQITLRHHVWLSKKPYSEDKCGELICPVLDCRRHQKGKCRRDPSLTLDPLPCDINEEDKPEFFMDQAPSYKPCSRCYRKRYFRGSVWWDKIRVDNHLTWREAFKRGRSFHNARMRGREFKMYVCPAKTISVKGIRSVLDMWQRKEGFVPDVILVDYADLFAPEDPKKEFRHQQNETWAALRALSLERHALVIVPTQADAAALTARNLTLDNFSEDKRKYAHVTGMIGLHQVDSEKDKGLLRASWLLRREGSFSAERQVVLLQSLTLGRPHLASYWA